MTTRGTSGGGRRPSAARVADRIHSASIRLLRSLRRLDDRWGLSAPRLSALSVVVFGGPITLGKLARVEQVRPPTMTRLVQALESERLVTRRRDPDDKRVTWIRATTLGRRLLLRGRRERVRALTAGLESLTGAEIGTLDAAAELLESVAGRL